MIFGMLEINSEFSCDGERFFKITTDGAQRIGKLIWRRFGIFDEVDAGDCSGWMTGPTPEECFEAQPVGDMEVD